MSKIIRVGNSKGTYIPGEVLKKAHFDLGDEVSFNVNAEGQVVMTKDKLAEERDDVTSAEKKLNDPNGDGKQYAQNILKGIKHDIVVDDSAEERLKKVLDASKRGSVSDAVKGMTGKPLKEYL